jgi:hypothetical protein
MELENLLVAKQTMGGGVFAGCGKTTVPARCFLLPVVVSHKV